MLLLNEGQILQLFLELIDLDAFDGSICFLRFLGDLQLIGKLLHG